MTETTSARPITSQELAVFCRHVGAMMVAGVDILRALQVAADQSGSKRLQRVAGYLQRDLENGRLFAVAVGRFPDLFSPFFVSMVRQGEREGVLGQVLTSLADYLDRERGGAPGHIDGAAGAMAFDIDAAIEKLKPLIFWQMLTLGAIALGIAGLWWAQGLEWVPSGSMGPNVALWVGSCILLSALIFRRYHPPKVTRCSFCGRAETDRGGLVQGHGVAICPACLRSSVEQLKSSPSGAAPAVPPDAEGEAPAPNLSHAFGEPSLNGRADLDEEEPRDDTEKKRIEL